MKVLMLIKIYAMKFLKMLETLASMLVYNFHKKIDGIKSEKNIKYVEKANTYQKLDVHYPSVTADKKPIIVYFHGGGWTAYSKHIFTTLCRRLAAMGYVVFNCNYSLAPKYKMASILSDAKCAVEKAEELASAFGGDKNKIILAGDSAGAHISAMLMAEFNAKSQEMASKIKALVLFYGVYDLKTMLDSRFPNIREYAEAAIEGGIKNEAELEKFSPIKYDLSKFAPCFLASGEIDKLHKSQSKEMYKALKENGVNVQKLFFGKDEQKAMHAYMIVDGISTNVKTLDAVEKFLKEVVV